MVEAVYSHLSSFETLNLRLGHSPNILVHLDINEYTINKF